MDLKSSALMSWLCMFFVLHFHYLYYLILNVKHIWSIIVISMRLTWSIISENKNSIEFDLNNRIIWAMRFKCKFKFCILFSSYEITCSKSWSFQHCFIKKRCIIVWLTRWTWRIIIKICRYDDSIHLILMCIGHISYKKVSVTTHYSKESDRTTHCIIIKIPQLLKIEN